MRVNRKYSKGFLMAASAYRRHAVGFRGDFSAEALEAQYRHETFGDPMPAPSMNGYSFGKMAVGVTLAAMHKDYVEGLFAKNELLRGSTAYVRRVIRYWMSAAPFWNR